MVGSIARATLVVVSAMAATTTRVIMVAVVAAMGTRVAVAATRVAVVEAMGTRAAEAAIRVVVEEAATRGAEATRTIIGAVVTTITSLAPLATLLPMPSANSSIRSAKRCDLREQRSTSWPHHRVCFLLLKATKNSKISLSLSTT